MGRTGAASTIMSTAQGTRKDEHMVKSFETEREWFRIDSCGMISCVGNPDDRFGEDALRILIAMRFAFVCGLSIATETVKSIHKNKDRLLNIDEEHIRSELCEMLAGKGVLNILLEYSDVMATIIPELEPCIGFDQNNRFHEFTIYDHIAHAVANYGGTDSVVNVSLLLHDIGKPCCYTEDHKGGHFYGHGVASHDLAEKVLSRLRFDNKSRDDIKSGNKLR